MQRRKAPPQAFVSRLRGVCAAACALALTLVGCVSPAATRTDPNWIDLADGSRLYVEVATGPRSRSAEDADVETLLVPLAVWFAPDLELLAFNRRVVFYGLRGRSRSIAGEPPRVGLEADVAELEAVREALGLERVSILGWSYMAGVATRYALEHPGRVDKLVLVAPFPLRKVPHWDVFAERFQERLDPEEVARLEAALADEDLARSRPDQIQRRFLAAYMPAYVADPDSLGRMKSRPWTKLDERPDRAAAWQERVHVRLGEWDWREAVGALRIPVLIVQGTDDVLPLAAAREWEACLSDARLLELDGIGHVPWLEDPFSFFVQVESFLSDGIDEATLFAIANAATE